MARFIHDVKCLDKKALGKSKTVQVGSWQIIFDDNLEAKNIPTAALPYFKNAPKLFKVDSRPSKS